MEVRFSLKIILTIQFFLPVYCKMETIQTGNDKTNLNGLQQSIFVKLR